MSDQLIVVAFCSLLAKGMALMIGNSTNYSYKDLLKGVDISIEDENHDLKKPLQEAYIDNLKRMASSGVLLLLHDRDGNLHESTYHYLALKAADIFDLITNFLTEKSLRTLKEVPQNDFFYLSHRSLMRHSLGYFSLEFYMTLIHKSRQEALLRLDEQYPGNTRSSIIHRQIAKNNFDHQFSKLMMKLRKLLSEQMVFSEKTFYWNAEIPEKEMDDLDKSDISGILRIQTHQKSICGHLEEYEKVLRAKSKFMLESVIPDEIEERNRALKEKEEALNDAEEMD